MRYALFSVALLFAIIPAAPGADASDISVQNLRSDDTLLAMGRHRFDNGRMLDLSVGIGSGAFHHPEDPPGVIWMVGDRGPNLTCDGFRSVARIELPACRAGGDTRIFLTPSYAPSLYRVLLTEGAFRVTDVITLKDRDGVPLSGLPGPGSGEVPLDAHGDRLPRDARGVDAEAMIRLTDGTFWIADENVPSLLHVGPDGRIVARHVPQGIAASYANAPYEIVESLPAILAQRGTNRGIEALAVSGDERFLYFALQSPLANPDATTLRTARNVRLFKLERTSMQIVGEFVYVLDEPKSFRDSPRRQSDVRISEMVSVGPDRLLVLERTDTEARLREVDLHGATNILGSAWDDPRTTPSLEQQADLTNAGIVPATGPLRLDTADFPKMPHKIEGIALLEDGTLALVNDNDFGVTGAQTQIVLVRGLGFGGSAR